MTSFLCTVKYVYAKPLLDRPLVKHCTIKMVTHRDVFLCLYNAVKSKKIVNMYTSEAQVLLDKEYSELGESVIIKFLKTIQYKWKSVGRHIDKFNKNYTDWLDMDIISEDPECDTDDISPNYSRGRPTFHSHSFRVWSHWCGRPVYIKWCSYQRHQLFRPHTPRYRQRPPNTSFHQQFFFQQQHTIIQC